MGKEPTRYSREELNEFEEIIQAKLARLKTVILEIKQILNRQAVTGIIDYSTLPIKLQEKLQEGETLNQIASKILKKMQQLQDALLRIKNGTFGVNYTTGKLIPKGILRLHPEYPIKVDGGISRRRE